MSRLVSPHIVRVKFFLQAMIETSSYLPKVAGGERLEGFLHVVHPGFSLTQGGEDLN